MIEVGDRIVIGVSGGADSVALFLLLQEMQKEYNLSLFVVHVNHGIRKEDAKADEEYVKKLSTQYQVPFYLYEGNIPALAKEKGMTEEEMGREYRYQCFLETMEKNNANKLAVAHHIGDQAETVLFHMIRGSNIAGVTGIRPVNDLYIEKKKEEILNAKVIRPLLQCSKQELMLWLMEKKITWQEDFTNRDNTYSRNKLRNQIFPQLEEINEQAIRHVAEFADCMSEYQDFFVTIVKDYINENVTIENNQDKIRCVVNRKSLIEQKKILTRAILYELLTMVCGKKKDILREHVELIYELLEKQTGKSIMLPYHMKAEISYENLVIGKDSKGEEVFDWEHSISLKEIDGEKIGIPIPSGGKIFVEVHRENGKVENQGKTEFLKSKNSYTKFYDCDRIGDVLYLRTPQKEDFFVINQNGSKKKLSRYFIDQKVPMDERKNKIIVAVGHEVLWIVGERRCENYKIEDDTKDILVLRYEGAEL